jgi:leucyl-tRNA synthetase
VQFTQYEILLQIGISEEEIPKFTDSMYWLDFFPPRGVETLKKFGVHVDWRRSFYTTERNPYYDSFIRWQFHHLKQNGKIKFGKRYTIFSEQDGQPCADHDRAKGEGVMPQEYTGIKIKCLELPESMAQFEGRDVYLVAATLRPETMYGQTNCFILPEGNYGVYEMKNGELFVVSTRAARGMAYQDLTKDDRSYPELHQVKGQEFIGKKVKAPLCPYEHVYVLPLPTISMVKGTGIVTSVPSDAPNDYQMLIDLQTKKGLREKMNIDEEWVKDFNPIPIISCPTLGDICAKTTCEEFKVQSHKDVDKLELAKNKCYQEGFDHGVMLVGICEGQKVQDCKQTVKEYMINEGMAVSYWEPTSEVQARSGDMCIVAACD